MLALTVTAVMLVAGAGSVKAQSTDGPYTTTTPISTAPPNTGTTLGTLAFPKFNPSLGTLIGIKFDITTSNYNQQAAVGNHHTIASSGWVYSTMFLDVTDASSYISSGTFTDEISSGIFSFSGLAYGVYTYSTPTTVYSTITKTFSGIGHSNLMNEFTGSSGSATLTIDATYGAFIANTSGNSGGGGGALTVGVTGQVTYIYGP